MNRVLGKDETFQEEGSFFEKAMGNPDFAKEEDLSFLEETIAKYPYFQTARLVYSKVLKDSRSFKFHEALKTTAIYTPNRTMLFKYLNPHIAAPTNPHLPSAVDTDALVKEQIELFSENVEPESTVEELIDFSPRTIEDSHEFGEQFKDLVEDNTREIQEAHSNRDISNVPIKESLPKSESISHDPTPNESGKTLSSNRQLDLMNKFIKQNPKISPSKVDYSEEQSNNVPISDDFKNQSLMTETLAQVYAEQGLYDKAIRTYKLLSLKYPQKSGYFADQVKKIQQQKK